MPRFAWTFVDIVQGFPHVSIFFKQRLHGGTVLEEQATSHPVRGSSGPSGLRLPIGWLGHDHGVQGIERGLEPWLNARDRENSSNDKWNISGHIWDVNHLIICLYHSIFDSRRIDHDHTYMQIYTKWNAHPSREIGALICGPNHFRLFRSCN